MTVGRYTERASGPTASAGAGGPPESRKRTQITRGPAAGQLQGSRSGRRCQLAPAKSGVAPTWTSEVGRPATPENTSVAPSVVGSASVTATAGGRTRATVVLTVVLLP